MNSLKEVVSEPVQLVFTLFLVTGLLSLQGEGQLLLPFPLKKKMRRWGGSSVEHFQGMQGDLGSTSNITYIEHGGIGL